MKLGALWNLKGRRRPRSRRNEVYGGRLLEQWRQHAGGDHRRRVDRQTKRASPATTQSIIGAVAKIAARRRVLNGSIKSAIKADDIRAIAAQVDAIANNAATAHAIAALEKRVDTLIDAVSLSRETGEALPRNLEKLLVGLVGKLKSARFRHSRGAAVAAATPVPSVFARALRRVAVAACLLLFVAGGLRFAPRTALFDAIVSGAAPQAQSPQVSVLAVAPAQTVAEAGQAPLETPPLPMPNPRVAVPPSQGPAIKPVGAGTPPAGAQPGAGVTPSWAVPEITGALPWPDAVQVPSGPGRSVAIVEDKLPAAIGNPALRAAAIAGDPAAAYEVASRFAEGRGVPPSNEDEARWLDRAARQGLAPAQFRLGGLYERGIGVKKDLLRARDLYLAAAQKGNAKAMHNLAVLYAEGVSGTPDYNSAAIWFRKAADRGLKDSQYNLAVLYARGVGVEQNYAESYKWFVLAANQGDGDSDVKRNEVAAHLDAQTLEAARLAAQSWSPEPQPDDAINVKTQAAWETPAETPHPVKPKPRPSWGDTRAADARPN